jgi:hypothetical protein
VVDDTGQLVGRGGDSLWASQASAHGTVVVSQVGAATSQSLCGQA